MRRLATGSVIFFISLSTVAFVFVPAISPEKLIERLEAYLEYYTPEKIYLHTDKPYYSTGDTIWFATYLVHGVSHMATAPSKIVYVELINSEKEVISRLDIGIEDGTGAGEFALADTLDSGEYLLRAYTSFMRNFDQGFFYHKQLRIENISYADNTASIPEAAVTQLSGDTASINIDELIDVQFFPEGGDLVVGLWSTVGVKVMGPDGKGIEAQGEIRDSGGNKVADFSVTTFGMGKFRFFPSQVEAYKALLRLGSQSIEKPFPTVVKEGYVLSVSNLSKDYIAVKVEGNTHVGVDGGFLMGHIRGNVFLTKEANEAKLEALIPKKDLHDGIAILTWFDREGRPQCERLVFIEQKEQHPQVTIKGLKDAYKKREKVEFEVEVLDNEGNPTGGMFSVAVTDTAKIHNAEDAENIRSYLLLSADLKGKIESPGYYFNEKHRDRVDALDNLLLTQGWRRFTWKDLMEENELEVNHLMEPEGFTISGIATDFYNKRKPLIERKITLTATSRSGDLIITDSQTDSIGFFQFNSIDLIDTTNIIFQTPQSLRDNKKLKSRLESGEVNTASDIALLPFISPEVMYDFDHLSSRTGNDDIRAFLEEMRKIREVKAAFEQPDVKILDEIEIIGNKVIKSTRFEPPGKIYSHFDVRIDVDSISKVSQSNTIFDLFYGLPGVKVIQTVREDSAIPFMQLSLRGRKGIDGRYVWPVYLVNGVPSDIELVKGIPVSRIDFIDILESTGAGIYGSRAAGGVIAIYLKDERNVTTINDNSKGGITSFVHPGYYHGRNFYSPDYTISKKITVRPDIRPTLYWKPGLRTNELGSIGVIFHTSDVSSKYEVTIEGITLYGRPFVIQKEFSIE